MNQTEILILTGSPGSGKTTVADRLSEVLTRTNTAHAWIDVDDLSKVFPKSPLNFKWTNLLQLLPNYLKIPNTKIILPGVIQSQENVDAIRLVAGSAPVTVCELTASADTILKRVLKREPDEYWREQLKKAVHNYASIKPDITITTEDRAVEEVVSELIQKLGWQ